jgi:hypothetical protein
MEPPAEALLVRGPAKFITQGRGFRLEWDTGAFGLESFGSGRQGGELTPEDFYALFLAFFNRRSIALHATSPAYPRYRSHLRPRSRAGKLALAAFGLFFALAEPPAVYLIANRIEPRILEMPFLYAYLLLLYLAMIGVLIWAAKRGL